MQQRELVDRLLAEDLADALAHDRRTEHLDLRVGVDRRVAHLEGVVGGHDERELVLAVAARVAGLTAVWDLVRVAGAPALRVVDIGCGAVKQLPGAVGVDAVAQPGVDVVADLDAGLPFESASVDRVFAIHVLEHVADLLAVMRELHRILRPEGVLHVLAPDWRHVNAVADPTHVRQLDARTFRWFCLPRPGVPSWRPLMVSTWDATIHADLRPVPPGQEPAGEAELARWFS
jgi:SAM-dependent methyltransferase